MRLNRELICDDGRAYAVAEHVVGLGLENLQAYAGYDMGLGDPYDEFDEAKRRSKAWCRACGLHDSAVAKVSSVMFRAEPTP